ncbi:MAG: 4'-phosphopantetheinyl transferase superfamily protein [Rikenellaceae bacterium]|nr:4'-phosphopantetheinyl transferase superfamily protein [Rikenellaceae bacterium]
MPLYNKCPVSEGFLALWRREESTEQLLGSLRLLAAELEYYHKIDRQSRRRKEWLTWHRMLRMFLGEEVHTDYDQSGAPILIDHPGYISVSHSTHWVALYYQPFPCGVDIEECGRNFDRVSDRYVASEEWNLPGASRNNRFQAVMWCLKETVYKFAAQPGLDLLRDIRVIALNPDRSRASVRLPNGKIVRLKYEFLQDHCLAYTLPESGNSRSRVVR